MADGRQKDIVLLLLSVQLSVIVVAVPQLSPLILVSVIVFVGVAIGEASRRRDEL